ncbi:hypothetical protein FRC00_010243 [Tulasnella sp. 408]|nr:hypothetical protein FRC00_010243 [Tulasnella sp. 408]
MDVLWIRWLGEDPEYPDVVVRAAHLIPSFIYGKTADLLTRSFYWDSREGDWENYYVNPFVDRDMLSRSLGTGVGHTHPGCAPVTLVSASVVEDENGEAGPEVENLDDGNSETESERGSVDSNIGDENAEDWRFEDDDLIWEFDYGH